MFVSGTASAAGTASLSCYSPVQGGVTLKGSGPIMAQGVTSRYGCPSQVIYDAFLKLDRSDVFRNGKYSYPDVYLVYIAKSRFCPSSTAYLGFYQTQVADPGVWAMSDDGQNWSSTYKSDGSFDVLVKLRPGYATTAINMNCRVTIQ